MRLMLLAAIRSRRFLVGLAVSLTVVVAAVASVAQNANATVTTLATFTTPGMYVWTVPTGVTTATFDVYGARGGSVLEVLPGPTVEVISSGGAGGEAKAKFTVHGGGKFEIVVGGQGGSYTQGASSGGQGGFSGGGAGIRSGGGGGGSDVRIGGRGNACASTTICGYSDRIIVGGGGGGAANASGFDGEVGGGVNGCCGSNIDNGGTQEYGARCRVTGNPMGGFGVGGDDTIGGSGGGGGGWYGGCSGFPGGGGSGYISPLSKTGSFPGGTNAGDGKVIITTS